MHTLNHKIPWFFGPLALFRGIGYVVGTPRVWGMAAVPLLIQGVLFGVGGYFGVLEAHRCAVAWVPTDGPLASALFELVRVALVLLFLFAAFLVSVSLAQPLSGPAIDSLCKRRWEDLGGVVHVESSWFSGMLRSVRVTFLGLVVGGGAIAALSVITFLVPPASVVTVPLKLVVGAFVIGWDVLDYPFSLHELRVRERIGFIRANARHVLLFGIVCELCFLVPGFGLLMLPMAAAGATDLFSGLGAPHHHDRLP